ncbi:MAG: efflux RND transporter periplasmic adaptor subunit [Planctomycetota bacterium]
MRRFIFGAIGGILVTVIILASLAPILLAAGGADFFNRDGEEATEVRLASVAVGTITRTINAPGEIEARSRVEISAQVSARVVELPFEEGDAVRAGDVVVRLDDRDLSAALDATRAQMLADEARLSGAQADLNEAQTDAARQEGLFETKDTSQATLDAARTRLQRAESVVAQIRHAIAISQARIRQAERDLDNTIIRSPIDGVVTVLSAEVGELVVVGTLNNPGSVIMEIADLSQMLVQTRIDESNIASVEAGQPATVYVNAFQGAEFAAEVTFVGLARQIWRDGSGYIEAEVLLQDPGSRRLQTGLTANVDIRVETLEDVLKVPSQAVVDRRIEELPTEVADNSPLIDRTRTFARVVYIYDTAEGVAKVRPVEIGASDLTDTVIVAGLEADEMVIVGPFKALRDLEDGARVKREGDDEETGDDSDGDDGMSERGDA